MSNELFVITDGTTEIDFLDEVSGFHLADWNPAIAQYKGGGVFQDSLQADGRRLVDKRFMNAIETLSLKARDVSQDALIYEMQEIRRLFEKAAQYWTTSWQNEPVYIKARASNETNVRYAIIYTAMIPEDDYPYGMPFLQPQCEAVMDELTLVIERGPWLDNVPGEGTCVEIAGYGTYCWPCHVEFNGTTTNILVSDNATIQDLHDAAMTVEGWVRADGWGEGPPSEDWIFSKRTGGAGWFIRIDETFGLIAYIECAVQAAYGASGLAQFSPDSEWHHVAFTWDDATYTNPRIWIDGVEQTNVIQVRNGAVGSDVGNDLYIGNRVGTDHTWDGGIGWTRVSDYIRYASTFTPPDRCILPEIDGGTVGLWIGAECSGATIDNMEGTAAIDGTLSNGTFGCCERYYGNIDGEVACSPSHLEFDGIDSIVNCGSNAVVDNLPDFAVSAKGILVIDGWVRPDGYGGLSSGFIAWKNQWRFQIQTAQGLRGVVECVTRDAVSASGTDEFDVDYTWHHVLMVYDEQGGITPAARTIYLAIDGNWVSSYSTQISSQGNYNGDAAADLEVGSRAGTDTSWHGGLGWIRVRDALPSGVSVGVAFTAPVRCTLPDASDANTLMLIIHEGVGHTVTRDLSGNSNDGLISDAIWSCDCSAAVAGVITPTCEDEVYIANKRNDANITNVHYWDSTAGVWSGNLMGAALPYDLLPAVPAAGDVVIFGIDTTMLDSGPFCSLVFDLATAQVDLTTVTWRYSDVGADPTAWGALTVQDNTNADGIMTGDPFDTTGVRSVHWAQPSDWTTQNPQVGAGPVLGVTGYWIAAHVVVIGAAPAPPTQQNRHIYSITWPFVEIDDLDILGDIPALLRMLIRNQSDTGSGGLTGYSNRFVIGLRSLSRGQDFTAYINLANEQNPDSITVTDAVVSNFVADTTVPTGIKLQITNPAAIGSVVADISIAGTMTPQYAGRFHCYLRGKQTTGAAEDVSIGIVGQYGSGGRFWESEQVAFQNTNDWQILDMGSVYIPGQVAGITSWTIQFRLTAYGNGASDAELYDMILIPIDEWAIDCVDTENRSGLTLNSKSAVYARGSATLHTYLDIDGRVRFPKRRTMLTRLYSDDEVAATYLGITGGDPILQANAEQRLWFLSTRYSAVGSTEQRSEPWVSNTIQQFGVARYLSMRGRR